MERDCSSFSAALLKGRLIYVEARLQGGAPWGFTLKGGLEHGEALIISKVEEGGKADLLQHPLQPGDQVVNINEVELSGSRQEAISLVKGSYKTLRLTVCRDSCPDPCCSEPEALPTLNPPSYSHGHPQESRGCAGGVKLRIKNRRSEPATRPHSWHSTKLGEGPPEPSMMQISQGTVGAPWPQTYHSSASTADLSSYDPGYLRKSPDQYSSRGSMESLEPGHPAYSSCHQLSPSKSSSSIDHLHGKRDSAYSSFSTSSSIPEYPAAAGLPLGQERSYSVDSMLAPQHRGPEGPRQADIRYVRTVYDAQQGISEEHEVSLQRGGEGRAHAEARGGVAHRSSGSTNPISHRHSMGPVWGTAHQRNSFESLKGAPPPPQRSDSYAAIRNHERPSSCSSLEQARSMRTLHKGSWHHSSGSVAPGKPLFTTEGQQLHTLVEKSPESSPTTRPRQGLPQASPTGRLIMPTGIYQVPPPEPHFAQAPACCPSSSIVYPALAKESRDNHLVERRTAESVNSLAVENGYQSSTSSIAGQPPCTPQLKPQSHQKDKRQEEPHPSCGLYRSHFKPQPEVHSVPQMQSQDHGYTPVQQKGERPRPLQGTENTERYRQSRDEEQRSSSERNHHPEAVNPQNDAAFPEGWSSHGSYRDIGFQNTQGNSDDAYHAQRRDHGSRVVTKHHGNPGALQQPHPLTRLENALAEVQRAASPASTLSQCSSLGGRSEEAPSRRVSVLEKVNRLERRQEQGKVCSQSIGHIDHAALGSALLTQASGIKTIFSSGSSVEPLAHLRTQSDSAAEPGDYSNQQYLSDTESFQRRRGREEQQSPRNPWGKDTVLQRSKSTFQLGEENGEKDFLWSEDLQDILGTIQDTSFNTAYRDSIKDAQSKVLRSTSFRRKDLNVDRHTPSKHMSLERKGPKTMPKPGGMFPHTLKERYAVTLEPGGTAPPALPSVPAVGPPTVRIGGRKRLTLEQKKRSYSEPEKMNEVGVSESKRSSCSQGKGLEQLLLEASVADKRKLFELAAHRSSGPGPSPRLSSAPTSFRPDLKQLQQDALVEYMERKTGRRIAMSQRPKSAYLQPSPYSSDTQSLSSTSSLASLQEPELQGASCSSSHQREGRLSSTLPPGLQGYFYSSGNPAHHPSPSESTLSAHRLRGRPQRFFSLEQELDKPAPVALSQPLQRHWLSQYGDTAFERAAPARNSGKSASVEDLLQRSGERAVPQHIRSRSSPSAERLNQDVMTGDDRLHHVLHSMFAKGPTPFTPTETRPAENAVPESPAVSSERAERHPSSPGPSQLKTPAARREQQRAQGALGLAASVGLPSPFPPPGAARRSSADSGASDETLKDFPREGPGRSPPPREGPGRSPPPRESPAPPPAQPLPFLRVAESSIHFTSSLPIVQDDDEVFLRGPAPTPPPPPPPPLPVWQAGDTEDLPPPPPPPPLLPPFTAEEEEYTEMHQSPRLEQLQSANGLDGTAVGRGTEPSLPSLSPSPSELLPRPIAPSLRTDTGSLSPASVSEVEEARSASACEAQESLELEYPSLSRRERSAEELRVEALARDLVSRDRSLTPILDTWAVKKTMELMEHLFPATVLPRQRRRSSWLEDRSQNRGSVSEETARQSEAGQRTEMETDLDEAEVDLSQMKAELVRALSQSVAALRGEREALAEEQSRLGELGDRVEALVQELCKANERDKYRMFVGDQEKMVNLLLSLCGQLARVENALKALEGEETEESAEERESLQKRRRRLCGQHEDARELKENSDRRERAVLDILGGRLSAPQLRDFQHFVRAKPALLVRQRHLEELIRLGEEQLRRLAEDLPPESPAPRSTAVTSL